MKTTIIVKTNFRATHCWPEATEYYGDQIEFLENQHRHTFHVKVEYGVQHDDRDVEFFVFQKQIDDIIRQLYPTDQTELVAKLGRKSCEQIAKDIINKLHQLNYENSIICEVWEDDEVGAKVQVDSICE